MNSGIMMTSFMPNDSKPLAQTQHPFVECENRV